MYCLFLVDCLLSVLLCLCKLLYLNKLLMTLDNVKYIIVVLKKPYCSCHQHYCPPPFRRKMEGHCFPFSVVRGSGFLLDALSLQLLLQLKADPFET